MADSLEERLKSHAQAFDGLLSLIPAKYYYGEDTSDQWQRKKQTKEEARKAKRAKLDPDSEASKTAKDIMDENALKRKREDEGVDSDGEPLGSEKPREGLKRAEHNQKKQKEDEATPQKAFKADTKSDTPSKPTVAAPEQMTDEQKDAERRRRAAERRRNKREAKKAKVAEEQEKKAKQTEKKKQTQQNKKSAADDEDSVMDEEGDVETVSVEGLNFSDTEKTGAQSPSTASSNADSALDSSNMPSGSSSISSMLPPDSAEAKPEKPKLKIPKGPAPEALKERLQKRLDELRAARHADGLNGKPARSRQELIEARREKEEKRKQLKKEQRQKEREAQQAKEDEAIARRFSPTAAGSLLNSPRSPATENGSTISNNFSFGRIAFADGAEATHDLSNIIDPSSRRKGPQDPATALKAAEAKQARLNGFDENKRKDIEEKDMWLNAKKRAHGERVRDDTSLLKKALKRKAGQKKKSEKEWTERKEGLQKSMFTKQRKREDNLNKRKEEKAIKKLGGGVKKNKAPTKKKSRPGFEGSFRTGGGGGKKK